MQYSVHANAHEAPNTHRLFIDFASLTTPILFFVRVACAQTTSSSPHSGEAHETNGHRKMELHGVSNNHQRAIKKSSANYTFDAECEARVDKRVLDEIVRCFVFRAPVVAFINILRSTTWPKNRDD